MAVWAIYGSFPLLGLWHKRHRKLRIVMLALDKPMLYFLFPFSVLILRANTKLLKEFFSKRVSLEFYQSLDTAKRIVEDPPTQQQQQQHSAPAQFLHFPYMPLALATVLH
jgi:hypothetical protein